MEEIFSKLNPETIITVGDKEYKVTLAKTPEEKTTGLSNISYLPKDQGMLFIYDEPQDKLYFTMEDTEIDLDIVFIDEDGEVISVYSCDAFSKEPVYEEDAQLVLEVNKDSGIKEGDKVSEEDIDLNDDDKEEIKQYGKMLILDENGNVQFKIEGGERIVSRIDTRKLIKKALQAFKSDDDKDYKSVGKLIFKILDAQDNRKPEYVQSPD